MIFSNLSKILRQPDGSFVLDTKPETCNPRFAYLDYARVPYGARYGEEFVLEPFKLRFVGMYKNDPYIQALVEIL
jgi:hypothetical protein